MDDITFGRSGPYGYARKAEPTTASGVAIPDQSLMCMNALFPKPMISCNIDIDLFYQFLTQLAELFI